MGVQDEAYLVRENRKELTCSIRITEKEGADKMQILGTVDYRVCGGGRYRGYVEGVAGGVGVSWSCFLE